MQGNWIFFSPAVGNKTKMSTKTWNISNIIKKKKVKVSFEEENARSNDRIWITRATTSASFSQLRFGVSISALFVCPRKKKEKEICLYATRGVIHMSMARQWDATVNVSACSNKRQSIRKRTKCSCKLSGGPAGSGTTSICFGKILDEKSHWHTAASLSVCLCWRCARYRRESLRPSSSPFVIDRNIFTTQSQQFPSDRCLSVIAISARFMTSRIV